MQRAGLTDVLVTGMPTRWIKTSTRPMGMPAKPTGAFMSVAAQHGHDQEEGQDNFGDESGGQAVMPPGEWSP